MGLETAARWFVELVVHKGYTPSQEQLDTYNLSDMDFITYTHDTLGCLASKQNKIEYWRTRLQEAKQSADSKSINFCMQILSKYIRGIYR